MMPSLASPVSAPRLVDGFSIEATPKQLETAAALGTLLPAATSVYVPYLPRAKTVDTVDACRRLTAEGLRPVPHLAARALASRDKLSEHLVRLAETGTEALLLIAGDRARPAGPFKSTLGILDSGLLQRHGFFDVGVAGHPEGHAFADAATLAGALKQKSAYAADTGSRMWVVTQFAFSAEPIVSWLRWLHAEDIRLPVRIGLPGPAKLQTLLRYAAQCGVAASSRMLARRPVAVTRLLGRWSPLDLLSGVAQGVMETPALPVVGIHVFPFGGLLQSVEFFNALCVTDP